MPSRKPTQNASIEGFNGKLRDECLHETLFSSLDEAREVLEAWKDDYNTHRPHSARENLTPKGFAAKRNMHKLAA
ncbi:transposase [Ruegeria sp. HKCCD6109]|nr:transposase [Ruegeria sp. HKCCD6109]